MQMPGAFSLLIMPCLFPDASLSPRVGALPFELNTHFLHLHLLRTSFAPNLAPVQRSEKNAILDRWPDVSVFEFGNQGQLHQIAPLSPPAGCGSKLISLRVWLGMPPLYDHHMATLGSVKTSFKMQSMRSRIPKPI